MLSSIKCKNATTILINSLEIGITNSWISKRRYWIYYHIMRDNRWIETIRYSQFSSIFNRHLVNWCCHCFFTILQNLIIFSLREYRRLMQMLPATFLAVISGNSKKKGAKTNHEEDTEIFLGVFHLIAIFYRHKNTRTRK